MRTSINQGRIQSLAVMIVVLINNDQTPYLTYYRILGLTVHATSTHWFQLPSPRSPENLSVMKSSRYPVLPESFWQSHLGFHASALPGISAPLLLLANQFHCIRQLRWAIDLLKAHHVIRPQQIYPHKRILSVLSFSEDKSIWKHVLSALRDKRCDIRDRG